MAHTVKRVMDVDGVDWRIDAPVPCPRCGNEAVAKVALLKARNAIGCRYCGRCAAHCDNPAAVKLRIIFSDSEQTNLGAVAYSCRKNNPSTVHRRR